MAIMNSPQYFIVCHDPNIISNANIDPLYKWIFVGYNDTNILKHRSDVIIAKNLLYNIECWPNLCAFTAWYAIAKNWFLSDQPVVLLEYDFIAHELDTSTKLSFDNQPDKLVFGYRCIPCGHLVFTKSTPWLEIGLKKFYNIDLPTVFPTLPKTWAASTNIAFKQPDVLYNFVDWFIPLAEFCANKPMGGYVHERAFHIFLSIYYPNSIGCIDNIIVHEEHRSHKQKDVCDLCKDMERTGNIHNCIKWLYKNLYDRWNNAFLIDR